MQPFYEIGKADKAHIHPHCVPISLREQEIAPDWLEAICIKTLFHFGYMPNRTCFLRLVKEYLENVLKEK